MTLTPLSHAQHIAMLCIRIDGGTQSRVALSEEYISELAQALSEGDVLPPIILFYDGSEYWLADGFHRYHAVKKQEQETIASEVKQGTRRDAILYSVGANAQHGLRRTNADKRRAVETLLRDPEWTTWSDRAIARRCGVHHQMVGIVRSECSLDDSSSESRTYRTKHGTIAQMSIGNIGQISSFDTFPQTECFASHKPMRSADFVFGCSQDQERGDILAEGEAHTSIETACPEDDKTKETQEDGYLGVIKRAFLTTASPHGNGSLIDQEKERRDAHVLRLLGSSESPEWYTPSEIVALTCELLGEIDLDPCSNSHDAPAVPARVRYTKEDNGLAHPWRGKTYLNPPYGSEIPLWVSKLIQSYEAGEVKEAIALLPGRIDTVWFQPLYAYLICHIQGRLQFANSPYHAPFPCVIVYLGTRTDAFIDIFKCKGPILRRVG